jgi:hypothetical protein
VSKIEKSLRAMESRAEIVPPATVPSMLPVPAAPSFPTLPVPTRPASPESREDARHRPRVGSTPFDATLQEHHGIRQDVQALTDLLGEYRVGMETGAWRKWMREFSHKLSALHERLREHFEEEEQSGLYEALGEKLPNLVPRTRVVREEHTTIVKELAGILATIDVLQPTFPLETKLLDRAREVLYRIVCHERKESDLIARAYLEELGEAD